MGFEFPNFVIFNFYAQVMPRRFLIDTMYVHTYVLCKPARTLNWEIFVYENIHVLSIHVNKFSRVPHENILI